MPNSDTWPCEASRRSAPLSPASVGVIVVRFVPRLLALTVLTGALVLPASAVAATVELGKTRVVRVGPLSMTNPDGVAVREAFGTPNTTSERYNGTTCVAQWRGIGLSAILGDLSGANDACGDTGRIQTITIKGQAGGESFHTDRGLRIGQTVTRLRKLYPRAGKHGAGYWLLTGKSFIGDCPRGCPYAVAEARVTRGRVSSLRLAIGAAGE